VTTQTVIYKPASTSSHKYLYIVIGGMLVSSALTITIVKVAKCMKKTKAKARIEDLESYGDEHIDKEKFFNNKKASRKPSKKMDEEEAVELAAPKHKLEVPGHHQALSQNQLLQEILSHRKALIQARAMAVDGTADSEGILGGGESVPD
jgi:hypothetical protein